MKFPRALDDQDEPGMKGRSDRTAVVRGPFGRFGDQGRDFGRDPVR
jgi:hypothetical protein